MPANPPSQLYDAGPQGAKDFGDSLCMPGLLDLEWQIWHGQGHRRKRHTFMFDNAPPLQSKVMGPKRARVFLRSECTFTASEADLWSEFVNITDDDERESYVLNQTVSLLIAEWSLTCESVCIANRLVPACRPTNSVRHNQQQHRMFNGHLSRWTWISRYQNVSIRDFTGAKDDGDGGNSCTGAIRREKLQSNHHHQQTNIQCFYRPVALPVAQPTVSKHWRKMSHKTKWPWKDGLIDNRTKHTNWPRQWWVH